MFNTMLYLVFLVVSISVFYWVDNSFVADPDWTASIEAKCHKPLNLDEAYQARSLWDMGEACLGMGAFYGLLLQSNFLNGMNAY